MLWLVATAAFAQEQLRLRQGRNADGGGPQRMMPAEQRSDQLSPPGMEPRGGGNRLSPEERRQLRRDVHDAGRDLYSDKMTRGRHERRGPPPSIVPNNPQ